MLASIDSDIPAGELHRLLLHNLPGIALLVFDKELRYLTAQGSFLNAAGFASEHLNGKTLPDIFPAHVEKLLPKYQAALLGEISEFEVTWGEYICRVRTAPVRNDHNEIFAGMIIVEDITSQKRSEQAIQQSEVETRRLMEATEEKLREKEAQLQLLFENSLDSIFLSDREANILRANPAACKMFGRTEEELRTRVKLTDLLDVNDTRYLDLFQTILQTGHGRGELSARRRDGTVFPIESASTMLNRNPASAQAWTITRDMSDMKRIQQALLEREKQITALEKETELSQLKSRMMERVAHEFRTPFAIIRLTIELITKYIDHLDPAQVKERVKTIYTQMHRLSTMLDEIDIALRGKFIPDTLRYTSVDLSTLCREIVQALETQFAEAGRYSLDLPDSLPIYGDPTVLHDIFLHVLRNAAQFSPPSAAVTVSLHLQNDSVALRVTDSGIGILENEQPRIFESFFRGSNTGEIRGLGLGLTIVRDCVAASRGTIHVTSVPDQGTSVYISLPQSYQQPTVDVAN